MNHPTDDDLDSAAARGDDRGTSARPTADTPDSAAPRDTRSSEDDAAPTSGETDTVADTAQPVEIGGQKGPEPTRYGDWEKKGRCTDF